MRPLSRRELLAAALLAALLAYYLVAGTPRPAPLPLAPASAAPARVDGIMLGFGWALPGANSALAPLEEDAEFVATMRDLGRSCPPEHALGIAILAVKA